MDIENLSMSLFSLLFQSSSAVCRLLWLDSDNFFTKFGTKMYYSCVCMISEGV